jgi:hypothetical protein
MGWIQAGSDDLRKTARRNCRREGDVLCSPHGEESDAMIIFVSNDFAKRYQCPITQVAAPVQQARRADSWSVHVFKDRSTSYVLFMHDATLWPVIFPVKAAPKLARLLPLFLERVQKVWREHGAEFDSQNQSILFLKRTDRVLIGSMTEAVKHVQWIAELDRYENKPADWDAYEVTLQELIYGAFKYESPQRMLKALLGGG